MIDCHLDCPLPELVIPVALPDQQVDLIYLCYPNNPTGAVASKAYLKQWVDYANANGDQFATVNAMTGEVTYTGTSNFDSGGNLIIPMEVDSSDRDGDGATDDYVPTIETSNFGVDDIRTRVENYNIAAAALKKR